MTLNWFNPLLWFPMLFVGVAQAQSPQPNGSAMAVKASNSYLVEKMNRIVIPRLKLSGASLEEAVEFLRTQSREFDKEESNSALRGINFLLREEPGPPAQISLDLKEIPLIEALRYVTELTGRKFRIEPYAVLIEKAPVNISTAAGQAPSNEPAPQGKAVELAQKIILPEVKLRSATLEKALEFIVVEMTRVCERTGTPAVKIILGSEGSPGTTITLDLKDVPVTEALRYIAQLANYTLSSDDLGFTLTPR